MGNPQPAWLLSDVLDRQLKFRHTFKYGFCCVGGGGIGHPFGVVTVLRLPGTIAGVVLDANDDLADFLARYADACADASAEPLSYVALAALVEALLTSPDFPLLALH